MMIRRFSGDGEGLTANMVEPKYLVLCTPSPDKIPNIFAAYCTSRLCPVMEDLKTDLDEKSMDDLHAHGLTPLSEEQSRLTDLCPLRGLPCFGVLCFGMPNCFVRSLSRLVPSD